MWSLIEGALSRPGYLSTQLASCIHPQINRLFGLSHGFRWGGTVRHAPGQVGDFDDEGVVVRAPEHDQFVLVRHVQALRRRLYFRITRRTWRTW